MCLLTYKQQQQVHDLILSVHVCPSTHMSVCLSVCCISICVPGSLQHVKDSKAASTNLKTTVSRSSWCHSNHVCFFCLFAMYNQCPWMSSACQWQLQSFISKQILRAESLCPELELTEAIDGVKSCKPRIWHCLLNTQSSTHKITHPPFVTHFADWIPWHSLWDPQPLFQL
jgi:hypothetical protein